MSAQEKKKIAVILFNLGGPDSRESIKPFLFNFFMDKNIIQAPIFVRFFLAKLISIRRSKKEAGDSYAELGNKSPLLENSQAQLKALEKLLNNSKTHEFKVFLSMRYWHPMADKVAKEVQNYNADELVLLPLYPQFSTTTTRSSFQSWEKACKQIKLQKPTTSICCYPFDEGFIKASAENVQKIYKQAKNETGKSPRILFSAHGLPEKIIEQGDPYQWQCEQAAHRIVEALKIKNLDWKICYQSRVGPLKWIGPSTDDSIKQAAEDGVPVVIYPHAFTQEHVETLVELEIEYREMAEEMGLHDFYRVPTVGTQEPFIQGLADIVHKNLGAHKTTSDEGTPLCPSGFSECCMRS